MRMTLKAINQELSRCGHEAQVEKGDGYFYFIGEDVSSWLDRTVKVTTVGSLTLEQWVEEFNRLKKVNESIVQGLASQGTQETRAVAARDRGTKDPKLKAK